MLDATSKAFFHSLARIAFLKRLASRYGMSPEGLRTPLHRWRDQSKKRLRAGAQPIAELRLATHARLSGGKRQNVGGGRSGDARLHQDPEDGSPSQVSSGMSPWKLTQLGLDVDRATSVDNLRRICRSRHRAWVFRAHRHGELALHRRHVCRFSKRSGGRGITTSAWWLQSMLMRTARRSAPRCTQMGARVRLVKGAYMEPKTVAFQKKSEVDEAVSSDS